jgi:hypothetical protein
VLDPQKLFFFIVIVTLNTLGILRVHDQLFKGKKAHHLVFVNFGFHDVLQQNQLVQRVPKFAIGDVDPGLSLDFCCRLVARSLNINKLNAVVAPRLALKNDLRLIKAVKCWFLLFFRDDAAQG